jgi:alcohol dehydrogenase class IV
VNFDFATVGQIRFGDGVLRAELPQIARQYRSVLLVTGQANPYCVQVAETLAAASVRLAVLAVAGEPDLPLVARGVAKARAFAPEAFLAIGGGSAIDAAKAISCLAANPGDPLDYLEVVGQGKPLKQAGAPVIAAPTTAGTGAEVTRNAVLQVPEHKVKVSLRSPFLLPRMALVDPILTYSLPPAVTASTGMDALTQLIEPYLSRKSNPMTDLFCREGLVRVGHSLLNACEDGANSLARREMSFASLLGGLALANAGLGAVHGFAGVIGGRFAAAHGAVCAALLAPVLRVNYGLIQASGDDVKRLARFMEMACLLTGNPQASVDEFFAWLETVRERLRLPRLRDFGLQAPDFPIIVAQARVASSMKANPVTIPDDELARILAEAW